MITGAQASKITFSDQKSSSGGLVASGVEFIRRRPTYTVKARKEVVVSGGTVNSPTSWSSRVSARRASSKPPVSNNASSWTSAENVQDHIYCTSSFKLKPATSRGDKMRQDDFAKAAMEQYHGEGEDRGIIASAFSGFAYVPLSQYLSASDCQDQVDVANVDWSRYSKGVRRR